LPPDVQKLSARLPPHAGTALATSLVRHAIDALEEFFLKLDEKGNENHVLRYVPFVLGGIEGAGLSKVPGFREFAVAESVSLGRSRGEDFLLGADMAVACLGLVFRGPVGAVVLATAGVALSAV